MSQTSKASLLTLPTEILHQIFNDLDTSTLIWSVRNVCRRLRVATVSYNQYTLDVTSMCISDLRRLLVVIRPENVTTLIFCGHYERTCRQIDGLCSPINIDPFDRLRSLTVMNTNGTRLCEFLRHARRCSLTSLVLRNCWSYGPVGEGREIVEHFSSIVAQPTLVRLKLVDGYPSSLIDPREWLSLSKLRLLSITWSPRLPILSTILDRLPDLETLVLDETLIITESTGAFSNENFFTIYPRLTSLTMFNLRSLRSCVDSFLSHTPSLVHLKITDCHPSIFDESRFEEWIRSKLLALNKFEFHTVYRPDRFDQETVEALLNRVVAPFRTPFWTEEKRWLVIGTWHSNNEYIEIYTPLVSTPNYLPSWHPGTLTVTNFSRQGKYYTRYEDVLRLQLVSCEQNDSQNTVSNDDENHIKGRSDTNFLFFFSESIDPKSLVSERV